MPMKPPAENQPNAPGKEQAADGAEGSQQAEGIAGQIDSAVEELSAVESDLAEQRDRVLRLTAELENTRTRASRELVEERRYASLSLARDLLPVLDNIDRAIEAAGQDAAGGGSLLEGFKLVRQQLLGVLAKHQCEPIDAEGQPFDPQFHEAILQQPSAEVAANHVMMVTQSGYRMHDRVVRPSQVIVSSGPAS